MMSSSYHRTTRIILTCLLPACLLSGCSIKMAYNNLDRLVRWGVSDYVNLNREQRELLQAELAKVHAWHRRNHLPEYAKFMTNLSVTLTDTVTPATMLAITDQVFLWADEVEAQATPMVVRMMASLSDEQLAGLPVRLEESNEKIAEPELKGDLAKAQALWAEEISETLKQFVGRLNRTQQNYIEQRSVGYTPERVLWADYRRRFQADLLKLLERRREEAYFAAAYRELVQGRESYYGEKLTAIFEANQQLNREVAAHILSNLTEKQSARLVDTLTDLAEDFSELAAQEA